MDNIDLKKQVRAIMPWIVEVRRDFHRNPELGTLEKRTQAKIKEYLDQMDIEYETYFNTGLKATIRGREGSKTIGLRADMDALPIEDKKELSYSSTREGVMHGCGHDAHMAILLGVARILGENRHSLRGNVVLIFQPAEETVGGAKPMIEEGVLEDPYVDIIYGLHVDNSIPVGKFGIKYGQMKAASDMVDIVIEGKKSHGAYPQDGVDAIAIAGQIIVTIQSLVSRSLDPRSSGVVSIGKIKGGEARNVICDRVEMEAIVRSLNPKDRKTLLEGLEKIVSNIASSMGGKGYIINNEGYTALINNGQALDLALENIKDLFGEEAIYNMPYVSFGVEDFAFFSEARPGAFINLGTGNEEKEINYQGHTDLFDIDEEGIYYGVLLQLKNVFSVLS